MSNKTFCDSCKKEVPLGKAMEIQVSEILRDPDGNSAITKRENVQRAELCSLCADKLKTELAALGI